jgi:two-component system phosphate regulon sensor histidine kinase PhoR
MDNHRNRLEIQQADLSGTGMTVRTSDTLGSDLLYVAKKVTHDGSLIGFVRLSVPLQDVDASVNALRLRIIVAVTSILLLTGLFSLWQIEHLRRLTIQIRDFAAAVARGDFTRRLFLTRSGEFDEIAHSLNSMSKDLNRSIAASEEERNRLAVILRSIPDALLISDASGVIQLTSAASRTFFGDAPLQGRQFIEVVRDREFIALLDRVRQDLSPASTDLTLDVPAERHCIVSLSPLSFREGEISGFLAIFHDITQLKKLEQVRKDFVANISHEIRTPITAIQGFADTLLDGALEDREHARRFIETIRANSRRIDSLVDDLMTISKIELGVIAVEKTDVAFGDVAETVQATLQDKAARKGLALRTVIPSDAGMLRADRDRLVQILTNLVDNAVKFTDAGTVTIGMTDESGRTVLFVEDTGIGVAEKHLARLGERFYRVDAARSRNMGGTGLGLAIVKHLVKAHGWEMHIESTVGKGTKVRIIL